MLSLYAIKALADCDIKNGVLKLGGNLPKEEYIQLRSSLRECILDWHIPIYKPIAIRVCGTRLQRVTNIDSELDESYLGMIPRLMEAIIMPSERVETFPSDWVTVDDKSNRMFNTSRVIRSHTIPQSYLIYTKSFDSGEQRVDGLKFMLNKAENGTDISKESLKPLIKDSEPIVTISNDDTKSLRLEVVWAQAAGNVEYLDIEKTIGNTKYTYLPVAQTYELDSFVLVSLMGDSTDSINLGYKREIDESVLTNIISNFGLRLLEDYEQEINNESSPVWCFSNGKISSMWGGSKKCW